MEHQACQVYQASRVMVHKGFQGKGDFQDCPVKKDIVVQSASQGLGSQDFLDLVGFLEIKEEMDYQGSKASLGLQESPCLVLLLDYMAHRDLLEHLDSQALRGPRASLGLQASLDYVEIKESQETPDWFISLNCQDSLDLVGRRACLGFLGSLEKMACLGRLAVQVYQVPRESLVTSLVLKMVLRASKASRDCQGTKDFLETLAFQDPRVCMGGLACQAPKVSGAALDHQDSWACQAPWGLVVCMASRANRDSQEHLAFQALQDILEREVRKVSQATLAQLEREASLGSKAILDLPG